MNYIVNDELIGIMLKVRYNQCEALYGSECMLKTLWKTLIW